MCCTSLIKVYLKFPILFILFIFLIVSKNTNGNNSGLIGEIEVLNPQDLFLLQVDFSKSVSQLQAGFQGYLAEHENNNSFTPQIFDVAGTAITIDAEWPEGTKKEAKQMIDRGENSGNDFSNLLRDWIGNDGRSAKVPMKLTISGLPAGLYEWKSFHHDNSDQTGIFKVVIEDALGSTINNGIDISNGSLPLESVTIFETLLKSDGSDIVLSFEMETYPGNSTSFFVMNGFTLNAMNTTVVPDSVNLISPMNQLNYLPLNPELKWSSSYYADSYNLNLSTENPPGFFAVAESPGFVASSLEENTTYYWSVDAVNSNGVAQSNVYSFTTGKENSGEFNGEVEVVFSHDRKFYDDPFELSISSNNSAANIIYTVDCSNPSEGNGIIYKGAVLINSTTVVKAVAILASGNSIIITNSYLFPSKSAKQGAQPDGFPETWGGYSVINADYEMDSDVVNHPEYSTDIIDAFKSLPSLSLSMETDEWFNHETGLYVGYPNTNETREKPVTAEFIFNTSEENFAIECGVQNQGGTSIVKWKIPKQSMRLLFKEEYGPTRLKRKLFPDSEIESINTLVVDGLLYSWLHPWDEKQHTTALYFRDQLASDMQNEMGGLSFHGRYIHLYLNGLYWGVYDLHERPDDAFLSEYLDAPREDFDIVKHNPNNIVSGSNDDYLKLLDRSRAGSATNQNVEDIKEYLDIPAFIDYMILNFYLGNFDWAHQNWYAARNRTTQSGFCFYTWDAEHVMRYSDVNYNNTLKNNEGGPTEIHTFLKENEEYRIQFADAVYKHLFNDGALTPDNFEKSFSFRANEIEKAIVLESARWGDYRKEDTQVTYTKNEYWVPEVNKVLEEYIPKRRDIVIEQLRDIKNNLFPKNMPPIIEEKEKNAEEKDIKLTNSNNASGFIYFTLDGTDPRTIGGGINGTKYAGDITIGSSTILKARFYSSEDQSWSALAEEIYLFEDVFGENLVINEIMYHPENDYPEFIEIMNFGDSPVNLNGFTLSGGINYLFQTSESIQPGAGFVLSNDSALFENTYDFNAFGQYEKQLSNSGESIFLRNGFNQLVDSVAYTDTIPWPENADGEGYSLELIEAHLDNALWSSWKASEKIYGSPYNAETKLGLDVEMYPNPFSNIITVILDNPGLANEEFNIEVYNQTGSKVRSITSTSYNSRIEISLGDVLPGMYLIRVNAKDNTQFKGVVLKAIKVK
ncbi:MAG: CotH kinase family protein [Bacteroidetes bacterium]|nr:CotH kinase family protein [Bacteroidota bacterium]